MSKKEYIVRSTLADQVLNQLKRKIINQELKPGSRLIISRIAEELGTSLTPVREAMTRLIEEGLVEMVPHKGAYVAKPTRKEFEDLFAVRQALESLAVRLAAPKLSVTDFEKLDEIVEFGEKNLSTGDLESWLRSDEKLHDFIIRKSSNEVLIQIFSSIWDRIHTFRLLTARFPDRKTKSSVNEVNRIKRASLEHRNIVSALKERDVFSAEKLVMEHIENTLLFGIEEG
ncbi:TPA: GntR family transcriptional regulator [Candidatus Poribacteria bacterium]|nr:GntR family transcriptional regulator [Candidatus Poribacteria bacterium]